MKNTDLVKTSAAIFAVNERFRFENIIFSRLELVLWNMPTKITYVMYNKI